MANPTPMATPAPIPGLEPTSRDVSLECRFHDARKKGVKCRLEASLCARHSGGGAGLSSAEHIPECNTNLGFSCSNGFEYNATDGRFGLKDGDLHAITVDNTPPPGSESHLILEDFEYEDGRYHATMRVRAGEDVHRLRGSCRMTVHGNPDLN